MITGWVSCVGGREELVSVTVDVRDRLTAGEIPCPACTSYCKPTFATTTLAEDISLVTWRDGSWVKTFLLR